MKFKCLKDYWMYNESEEQGDIPAFKAGDKILRIEDSSLLNKGDIYTFRKWLGGNEIEIEECPDETFDQTYFELVEAPPAKSEAEIVKAWLDKLYWLCLSTDIVGTDVKVITEDGYELFGKASIDFVINSYEAYQSKAKQKEKQELLDKKAKLELELAQINEQLGE